jgi:HK97 family phage prohead protease
VKYLNFKIKQDDDSKGSGRKVIGLASVFGNKDLDGDIIDPSAFNDQFQGGVMENVKTLWQHNWGDPIGMGSAKLTAQGIEFETELDDVDPTAVKALNLVSKGIIDSFSIGFRMLKNSFDSTRDAFVIEKASLMEVSLVTFPANPLAKVSEIKSKQQAIEVERTMTGLLRDAGYSKEIVRRALSGDLFSLGDPGGAENEDEEVIKYLNEKFNLKSN